MHFLGPPAGQPTAAAAPLAPLASLAPPSSTSTTDTSTTIAKGIAAATLKTIRKAAHTVVHNSFKSIKGSGC